MLRHLSSCACVDLRSLMDDYEALVHIRNCIVHSAGVVSTSIFKKDLHDAVARIEGILIGNWHYFGDHICIKRDALESPINQTALLVVELHTKMEEQGLLK